MEIIIIKENCYFHKKFTYNRFNIMITMANNIMDESDINTSHNHKMFYSVA